tara:strand:- start:502 stop:639 length:138 start_codon:yes stop_codon:yes gene_type:complete
MWAKKLQKRFFLFFFLRGEINFERRVRPTVLCETSKLKRIKIEIV